MKARNVFFLSTCFLLIMALDIVSPNRSLVKRSDDPLPLQDVITRLTQDVARLQAQLTSHENEIAALKTRDGKRAAFLAEAKANDIIANAPIKLQQEQFDFGNGYDPLTGIYTAPYTGVYLFNFQFYPTSPFDYMIDLFQNGNIIIRSHSYEPTYPTIDASSIVVHANQGEKFWLQSNNAVNVWTISHTFFSGILIIPDV